MIRNLENKLNFYRFTLAITIMVLSVMVIGYVCQ